MDIRSSETTLRFFSALPYLSAINSCGIWGTGTSPEVLQAEQIWRAKAEAAKRLELSFSTPQLRDVCEKADAAIAALDAVAALELQQRLADIEACASAEELFSLFASDLIEVSDVERALRLKSGYRLVMRCGHVKRPMTSKGETDWKKTTRMRITAIEIDANE